jgi:hypothetical protein
MPFGLEKKGETSSCSKWSGKLTGAGFCALFERFEFFVCGIHFMREHDKCAYHNLLQNSVSYSFLMELKIDLEYWHGLFFNVKV